MKHVWDSAAGLLLVTGGLLGITLPVGKMATDAGASGLLWAFLVSLGAGSVLLAVFVLRDGAPALTRQRLVYYAVTAAVSYALPNALLYSAIPHLGAGYTGIMLTLSPVITLVLSLLLGVRRPNALGIAGIAVGFAGAALVAATRGEAGQPADLLWVLLALSIPLSLAVGNIYRTSAWPESAGPIELAAGSHLAAAAMLLAALIATQDGSFRLLTGMPLLVLIQVASAAAMFAFFFRLQAVGGPVYLSQIGYVAAAIGLFSGVLFLGERYSALTWLGAGIIVAGVVLTTRAQSREP